MPRKTTNSYPAAPSYPVSPSVPRTTRASSVFPYSLARPPTGYSRTSGVPRKTAFTLTGKPLVGSPSEYDQPSALSYLSGRSGGSGGSGRHTPVYARSDYSREAGGEDPGTAWSRSSWVGPRTEDLRGEAIPEEHEAAYEYGTAGVVPASAYRSPATALGDDGMRGMVPGPASAKRYSYARHKAPGMGGGFVPPTAPSSAPARSTRFSLPKHARRSTMSHVPRLQQIPLDDEAYDQYPPYHADTQADNPFGDGAEQAASGMQRRSAYPAQMTPEIRPSAMMTPGQHQRLGRMSVAAPRYSLPPSRPPSTTGRKSITRSLKKPKGLASRVARSKVGRFCLTWKPFILAVSSLLSALLLTMGLQISTISLSQVIKVPAGTFTKAAGNDANVTLGFYGWCQSGISNPDCEAYTGDDFVNSDSSFSIPAESPLDTLASLTVALAAIVWLMAVYHLVSAFLHFYLFFALSIPYRHLVDVIYPLPPSGGSVEGEKEKEPVDEIQAEVDLRARCDPLPLQGYVWVWWAWWAHRRSPVGHIYVLLVGVLSIAATGYAFVLKKDIQSATGKSVSMGSGGYLPLMTLQSCLDPMIAAVKYFVTTKTSFQTFLEPPEPNPAALLLPWEKTSHGGHERSDSTTLFLPPEAEPPLPVQLPAVEEEIDPETRRWIEAYPQDPELVPLIESLQQGEENDDFILSDVGLLYLRPSDPDLDEPALLVPPAGVRVELLEDAHLALNEQGEAAHHSAEEMTHVLNQTFWWVGMDEDVQTYIGKCGYCAMQPQEERDWMEGRSPPTMKPGMTPVEYTGVEWTGTADVDRARDKWGVGESAMAADMAVAMRKAQEEADPYA